MKELSIEEKQLLLKDFCARLPYGVNITDGLHIITLKVMIDTAPATLAQFIHSKSLKYYLRPLSSMTDDEREEYRKLGGVMSYDSEHNTWAMCAFTPEAYDWLNKKMFDYRGLIEMGLALEAPKDIYNIKTE